MSSERPLAAMSADNLGARHAWPPPVVSRDGQSALMGPSRYDQADFHAREETAALIGEAVPPNTALAYWSRWRSFEAWCREAGRVALPATPHTLGAYLTHLAVDRGLPA